MSCRHSTTCGTSAGRSASTRIPLCPSPGASAGAQCCASQERLPLGLGRRCRLRLEGLILERDHLDIVWPLCTAACLTARCTYMMRLAKHVTAQLRQLGKAVKH